MFRKELKNERLLREIREMVSEIIVSDVRDMKMISHWYNPKKPTDMQLDLDLIGLFVMNSYLLSGTKTLKELSEETGITTDALKQACQQDRLLTAEKSY